MLPEVLSKEPYGPAVLQSDYRWATIVRWVHFALIDAEELGVLQSNVDAMKTSGDGDVRQLLGADGALGKGIGLDANWAANAIKAVGNYGEIYDRNLGLDSSATDAARAEPRCGPTAGCNLLRLCGRQTKIAERRRFAQSASLTAAT